MRLTNKLLPGLFVLFLFSCSRGSKKQDQYDHTQSEPVSLELDMPKEDSQNEIVEVKEKNAFTAIILSDGKVYCYSGKALKSGAYYSLDDTTSFRSLLLKKKAECKDDLVVIIKPADAATYLNTVNMLDEMSISGIKQYAMIKMNAEEASFLNISVQKASGKKEIITNRLPSDNAFLVVIKGDQSVWYRILSAEHTDTILHKVKNPVTPNLADILAKYKAEKPGVKRNYLIKGDNKAHYPAFEKVINAFKQNEIYKYNLVTSEDELTSK